MREHIDVDQAPAPSDEGAVARLRAAGDAAQRRVANAVEVTLAKVFDAPFDVRTADEAMVILLPAEAGMGQGAARRAAEWGASRAARQLGIRFGTKVAGRAVAPIGMAVEFGFAAREGIRELQVLTSFLVARLRLEGYAPDPELVRRTVLAVYLEPGVRPDLKVALHRRSLAVARRWSVNTLPLTGRRQAGQTRRRVEAIAALPLLALLQDWSRVRALEVDLATLPPPRVIDANVATPSRPPTPAGPPPGLPAPGS